MESSTAVAIRKRFNALNDQARDERWRYVYHYRQLRDIEKDCDAFLGRSNALDQDLLDVLWDILHAEERLLVILKRTNVVERFFCGPSLLRVRMKRGYLARH